MTTILTVGNSEGERRCTAACQNAMRPECDCVCGGRFHGAARRPGGVAAVQREVAVELLEHVEGFGPLFAHGNNGSAKETI